MEKLRTVNDGKIEHGSGRLVFIHGEEPFLVPGQDDPRCFTISMLNLGEMNFESLNSPKGSVAILNLHFSTSFASGCRGPIAA